MQMFNLDKIYPIIGVDRLPSNDGMRHFVLKVWKALNKQDLYIIIFFYIGMVKYRQRHKQPFLIEDTLIRQI